MLRQIIIPALYALVFVLLFTACQRQRSVDPMEERIELLLRQMSLEEKIGQMQLLHSPGGAHPSPLMNAIKDGAVGAVLNEARPEVIRKMQEAAIGQSPHGIPLLFGRDVIHGFKTIFPVNIGLAATFDPDLVRETAKIAALEATSTGINWNFAPMIDVARDPRWGRMAESFGEDPCLVTHMGLAMMEGFTSSGNPMIACAKHFAGYGAAEGGRDYNTASIPKVELWNTYFRPFMALNEAGIATFMTAFNELNGIPATGNNYLLREVLKEKWQFTGFVVSDWASVSEMIAHGYAANEKDAALKAILGGTDMEMASGTYREHLAGLIDEGKVDIGLIDDAVRRILRVKYALGLFEKPYADSGKVIITPPAEHLETARLAALKSIVLLKNEGKALPLSRDISHIAVIGPMADDRYEQLGTWIFDGDTNLSITPLMALKEVLGEKNISYVKGLPTTRSFSTDDFEAVSKAVKRSDAVIIFAGEESIITGEAHSRAYLNLPGAQDDLVRHVATTGKPLILVVMTPRPLCIGEISEYADAVLYAWHPGTMAGPALAEIIFGNECPSGKLPVTFPKAPGQIPVYHAHKNTGRPPSVDSFVPIDEIPVRSFQTSLGNTSHYLDVGYEPLFPFGYGMSYTEFDYGNLSLSREELSRDETIEVSVTLSNTGQYSAEEVVQLYVRDMVASITRPVKELKAFKRVRVSAGERMNISFSLTQNELGFYDEDGNYIVEPGEFQVWVGGDASADLTARFMIIN